MVVPLVRWGTGFLSPSSRFRNEVLDVEQSCGTSMVVVCPEA